MADSEAEKEVDQKEAQRLVSFHEAQGLSSIIALQKDVRAASDAGLTKMLSTAVYVGPVDREVVLVQCASKLCMINLVLLSKECAYQSILRSFGAVARITLEPLCLEELLRLGIADPRSGYE